jgi:hypothetical protein
MFMLSPAENNGGYDGLVATAYAPCEVTTLLGGTQVHLAEETDYPFRGHVRINVSPASPVSFPMQFRIPAWASGATIRVKGEAAASPAPGNFARIDRKWKQGDRVEIAFPMVPRISRWFNDSIAIERGPLVFSLKVGENWVKLRDRGMTADWQVYPTASWNYALNLDVASTANSIVVAETEVGEVPFSAQHAPVRLTVKARKLNGWRAEDGAADPPPQSPAASNEPEETITLIPYAAAKLRITAFPQCKT